MKVRFRVLIEGQGSRVWYKGVVLGVGKDKGLVLVRLKGLVFGLGLRELFKGQGRVGV